MSETVITQEEFDEQLEDELSDYEIRKGLEGALEDVNDVSEEVVQKFLTPTVNLDELYVGVEYLVDSFIPEGNMVIVGHTNTKKTFVITAIIAALVGVTHPRSNLKVSEERPVLIFTEDKAQFLRMFTKLCNKCGLSDEAVIEILTHKLYVHDDNFHLSISYIGSLKEAIDRLTLTRERKVGSGTYQVRPLVVFDTVRFCFSEFGDENTNDWGNKVSRYVKALRCSTFVVHHTGKRSEKEDANVSSHGLISEGYIPHGAGASSLISNLEGSYLVNWNSSLGCPQIQIAKDRTSPLLRVGFTDKNSFEDTEVTLRDGTKTSQRVWYPILNLMTRDEFESHRKDDVKDLQNKRLYDYAVQILEENPSEDTTVVISTKQGVTPAGTPKLSEHFNDAVLQNKLEIGSDLSKQLRTWLYEFTTDTEFPSERGRYALDLKFFVAKYQDKYLTQT